MEIRPFSLEKFSLWFTIPCRMKTVFFTTPCGSKKYDHFSFDKLVDGFSTIVRTGFLLPNNNYGTRAATYQMLNGHDYEYYKNKVSLDAWIDRYAENFGIDINHLKNFYEYTKVDTVKFIPHHLGPHTDSMKAILAENRIDLKLHKELKCGFGYVVESLNKKEKPFIVGFSLKEEDFAKHVYNTRAKEKLFNCHDEHIEVALIKKLHEANLVDATFCAIEDSASLKVDSSLLSPTQEALDILGATYK